MKRCLTLLTLFMALASPSWGGSLCMHNGVFKSGEVSSPPAITWWADLPMSDNAASYSVTNNGSGGTSKNQGTSKFTTMGYAQ